MTASAAPPVRSSMRSDRTLLALLYLAFALTGVLTALPGPLLPILLQRWTLTDAQGGAIIAAQFLAGLIGALFANRDRSQSILMGLTLMALGTLGLAYLAWPFLLVAVAGYGLGLGLSIPAINLKVAERNADSRAASLSLLNCFWGAGAVSCAALVFVAQRFASIRAMLVVISAVLGVLLLFILNRRSALQLESSAAARLAPSFKGMRLALWVFGCLFFLYVGAETGLASWINVYASRLTPERNLTLVPGAYFWAALLIGRLAAAGVLRWMGEERLYVASLSFAFLALVPVLSGRSLAAIAFGAALCGLTFAPVYPLLIAFASSAMLTRPNSGWVFACASLGGALLPWTIGVVSNTYQLRIALLLPATAIGILLSVGLHDSWKRGSRGLD